MLTRTIVSWRKEFYRALRSEVHIIELNLERDDQNQFLKEGEKCLYISSY